MDTKVTEQGPSLFLDSNEIATAIDEYLQSRGARINGSRTIRLNGVIARDVQAQVIADCSITLPSGGASLVKNIVLIAGGGGGGTWGGGGAGGTCVNSASQKPPAKKWTRASILELADLEAGPWCEDPEYQRVREEMENG
jgi:hypothetical protein